MTLLARIGRLFKADIHGILDSLEEPEVILKQAVREMEHEIEQGARRLEELEKASEFVSMRKTEAEENLNEVEQQINCFFHTISQLYALLACPVA